MPPTRAPRAAQAPEKWNAIFRALAAEHRRRLLVSLREAPVGEGVPLPEGARSDALDVPVGTLRVELYHRHLPLLADHGFVEWDREEMTAYRGPRFDEVGAIVDAVDDNADALPDALTAECDRLEREG